ncbi:MAG: GGDEF domain-containing protein [Nitrospirae bacterium]|nr:GGDEF domain-containing protein [Nitrospirota bacterium]
MGDFIQEIFQRGGGPKRKGIGITRIAPIGLIFLSWLGLFFNLPSTKPALWFLFSLSPLFLYAFLYFLKKSKVSSFEILFYIALIIAGVIQLSQLNWLHIVYLLYIISLTTFYRPITVILLSLTVPLLEIRHFMDSSIFIEETVFNISVILTAVMTSYFISSVNKKRDKLESELKSMKEENSNTTQTAEFGSIKEDSVIAQYLSSVTKTDEEIKEVLLIIKQSIVAESVNLFVPSNNNLKLRCSSEDTQEIIPSGEGLITQCLKEKSTIITADINEMGYEAGYIKKGKITSFISIPIIDEPFVLGVLTADTSRFSAFNEADANNLQLFSKQLIRILQRERVYSQIQRSHAGLRVLHEGSSKLASSLRLDVLAQKLVESCFNIAPSSIIFLLKTGSRFEIAQHKGKIPIEKTSLDLKGTLLDMVKKNMEPLYLSDVRNYSLPLLPAKTKDISSVFILPLLYEKELLGMLVFLSEKIDAFTPYQIDLLGVLGTQASISIANARLHSEIEKMAVTDGLTGLFNHRHLQECLSTEFKRRERFSEPLALLLVDIDYFKKVNDTYGHPAGDKILHGVANILKDTIRNIDIAARYGGEEFAAILLGTESSGAKNMAERLRNAIMNTAFNVEGKQLQVTVSIGIAIFLGLSDKKESLIERADQALYHAKRNGRNRSVLWNEIKR